MLDAARSLNAFEAKCGASATLLRSFIERYVIPAEATIMRLLFLRPRNPAGRTQQLILPLAPLVQLGRAYGVAAQVQECLGSLAEALSGKGAGSVRNAYAVSKELPARRLARVVSKQLDLQHVRAAGGAEFFLEHLHRKAHLVGEAALDHGRGVAIWLIQKMNVIWFDDQVVEVTLAAHGETVHTDSFHRCWQGHRASWPVGVGIVEPTLYPDSG